MEILNITDLDVNKQIQFMNGKMFFMGKIVKTENGFLAVKISNKQHNVKIFNTNEITNFFIVLHEEAYWCMSIVIGCSTDGYSQLLILEQPKIINKIERRKCPRLPTVLDIEYCLLPDAISELSQVNQLYQRMKKKTFTIDISVGGVALITYEKFEPGNLLFLSFEVKENISSVCSVARSEVSEGTLNFKTALKFIDIDINHQNIINDYINKKMNLLKD
jgi:c-di-GMP-binding flagellar brake protein YcgR